MYKQAFFNRIGQSIAYQGSNNRGGIQHTLQRLPHCHHDRRTSDPTEGLTLVQFNSSDRLGDQVQSQLAYQESLSYISRKNSKATGLLGSLASDNDRR